MPAKTVTRHSPQTITDALTALAVLGSSGEAAKQTGVNARTIRLWKDQHAERYAAIQAQCAPRIDAAVIAELRQVAINGAHGTLAALKLERERIAAGTVKDASASAKNQAFAAGSAIEKLLVLEGKPTSIVEHRSADDVLKAMASKGYVDSTAHEELPVSSVDAKNSDTTSSGSALLPARADAAVRASTGQPV